jgi:hypothetical protein
MRREMRIPTLALLAMTTMLGACEAPVVFGLIETNNYRSHGRSATGWLMSVVADEDCDPMRRIDRKPVCKADPGPPPVDPVCYRSLAAVTCFDTPDPLMPRGRLLPAPGQTY